MSEILGQIRRERGGAAPRRAIVESIIHSPAGPHELYPRGSIVICTSCAKPLYRLERAIFIGDHAGRSVSAYAPVTVADLQVLADRPDVDAGLRAVLQGMTPADRRAHCDRIASPRAGDPCVCPLCGQVWVQARSSEESETRDRAYVIQLVTIAPVGQKVVNFRGTRQKAVRAQ